MISWRLRPITWPTPVVMNYRDEAFELAATRGAIDQVVAITAAASDDLLTTGRVDTLERWLDSCGSAALDNPGTAILRKSEVAVRFVGN